MAHRLIPLDSKNEWKEALQGIKYSFGHTWEHCHAMHLTTGDHTFLYSFEKEGTRIVSPIVERNYNGYTDIIKPFGYSGFIGNKKYPEFSSEWKNFAKSKGYVAGYLGLHPVFSHSGMFHPSEVYDYNNAFVLDLSPDIDQILANMARKRRQQFNHWPQIVSSFTENRLQIEQFFHNHYEDFLNRKNAKPYYYFSEDTISSLFSLENMIAVGAKETGKLVAATYFAYTEHMGNALYHLSLPGAEHYSAPLLWYGAIELKSKGVPALNFGGGFDGIAKFKKRFGTQQYPLKAVKQIYRDDIYQKLCENASVNADDLDGFFPAYRKK